MTWLYTHNLDNSARFTLGTKGERPLICFGINPSTATPQKLDNTVNTVRLQAEQNGYDSFIMLNVYPLRATNPNDLPKEHCPTLAGENLAQITQLINGGTYALWAAWGTLIGKRPYLLPLVQEIIRHNSLKNCTWLSRGKITKDGHPHHPLYVKKEAVFEVFDTSIYLK